jgi:hypothetical protein
MGFLDKLIRGVNAVAEPIQDADEFTDRSFGRAEAVAVGGAVSNGTIVGIRRRNDSGVDQYAYAIEVVTEAGAERVAVEVGTRHRHRLRLGLPVVVRLDGKKAALDWVAMCQAWGLDPSDVTQRLHRKPPDDGVLDTALDARVQKRLERGTRTTGTITALRRVSVLGMAADNWDVDLQLADGTVATSPKDAIPAYARWYAAPGLEVPVAVDPKDPAKASIDWPAVAVAAAGSVRFDEAPPAGSAAAEVAAPAAEPTTAVTMGGDNIDVIAANRDVAIVNATLRTWVDAVNDGHMKPKLFHQSVADWESAGMCTAEEAEAARRAVG